MTLVRGNNYLRGFVEAASTAVSWSLSGTPSVCFNTFPVSTTQVLALERRPAIMARPSQVVVLLRRQLMVRSFFSLPGQVWTFPQGRGGRGVWMPTRIAARLGLLWRMPHQAVCYLAPQADCTRLYWQARRLKHEALACDTFHRKSEKRGIDTMNNLQAPTASPLQGSPQGAGQDARVNRTGWLTAERAG